MTRTALSFDRHRFGGRKRSFTKLVASGCLAGSDAYRGVRIFEAPGRPWDTVPQFITNKQQMRDVLLTAGFSYCYARRGHKFTVPDAAKCDYKLLAQLTLEINQHFLILADGPDSPHWKGSYQAVKDVGGYVALCAGIAYRAWNLRWHDTDVASEMNISRLTVRNTLQRLRDIARSLEFPCFVRNTGKRRTDIDPDVVIEMWRFGQTIKGIAAHVGCCCPTVKNILNDAGFDYCGPMYLTQPVPAVVNRGRATAESIAWWWSMGLTSQGIANELGCSRYYVGTVLKTLDKYLRHGGSGNAKRNRRKANPEGLLGVHEPAASRDDGRETSSLAGGART